MNAITITLVNTRDAAYSQVYDLREEVLRRPIGLSLKDEDLSADAKDIILVAMLDDTVIGCLMLQEQPGEVMKFRQMAVAPQWHKQGVGKQLMLAAEAYCREHGISTIVLHARVSAQDFYAKLNYKATGNVFTEVGIPHVKMEKSIA